MRKRVAKVGEKWYHKGMDVTVVITEVDYNSETCSVRNIRTDGSLSSQISISILQEAYSTDWKRLSPIKYEKENL